MVVGYDCQKEDPSCAGKKVLACPKCDVEDEELFNVWLCKSDGCQVMQYHWCPRVARVIEGPSSHSTPCTHLYKVDRKVGNLQQLHNESIVSFICAAENYLEASWLHPQGEYAEPWPLYFNNWILPGDINKELKVTRLGICHWPTSKPAVVLGYQCRGPDIAK